MKEKIFVCFWGFMLMACVPETLNYAYNSKKTVAEKDRDSFECELAASRAVPTNTQLGQTSTYTTPAYTTCTGGYYGSVNCTTSGGQTYGGDVYSYDANRGLRSEYFGRCLAEKGYAVIEVPVCKKEAVPENVADLLLDRQRPPKQGACAVSVSDRVSNLLYPEEFAN